MAAINAKFVFTPAVPGVSSVQPLNVDGETLSEVKQKVKDALAPKKVAAQGQIIAIEAAEAAIDS